MSPTERQVLSFFFVLMLAAAAAARPLQEAEARHLLARTTLHFNHSDVQKWTGREPSEYLDFQLNVGDNVIPELSELPHLGRAPREIFQALIDRPDATQVIEAELIRGRLIRGIKTDQQFREVMTEFWFNHFNADPDKGAPVACNVGLLEGQLRDRAIGKFRDILEVAVVNPAVLENLDAAISKAPRANENLGRELMELYTVGPTHTQEDVIELSRLFTGWSYEGNPSSPNYLEFRYYRELHMLGPKVVLGHSFADHEQDRALDMLARHPNTAEFISRKLVTRLVSDDPPPELIALATARFTKTDGDIFQVVSAIVESDQFYDLEYQRAKLKTPQEFLVSLVTELDLQDTVCEQLARNDGLTAELLPNLMVMGSPYSCPNPLGWPDSASTWTSGMGQRARWAVAKVLTEVAGVEDWSKYVSEDFQSR